MCAAVSTLGAHQGLKNVHATSIEEQHLHKIDLSLNTSCCLLKC